MMSSLIKDIFLPEKIGTNYLFAKYVVGVEISKTSIIATKIRLQGHNTTIEAIIEEKLETESSEADTEPTTRVLKSIFAKIGSYDEIYTTVPSSVVIFKELKLPFTTREKINMVIGFEIEPLLPFSLHEAVIDFIITREIPEEKSAEILVTAVQKQHIIELLTTFEKAELRPTLISVDMISLYGIYKRIPSYNHLEGGTALIDIGLNTTRIALMINSQLKVIRTLTKGIIFITKKVAQTLNVSPNEIMEKCLRFGLENGDSPEYTEEMKKGFAALWDEIAFTLNSFTTQLLNRNAMSKIILLGDGSLIKGIPVSLSEKLKVSCEQFRVDALSEDTTIRIKKNVIITPATLISIGAALSSGGILEGYNLETKEFSIPNYVTLLKQCIVLIVLTIGLFAGLFTHYTIQVKKLRNEISSSQQEALKELKAVFKTLEDERILTEAIDTAQIEITEQKETFFAFSSQSRASFLQCLLELTSKIDNKSIGLDVEQITIAEGILILKAQVKDHAALTTLERELGHSKLFSYVEPQENTQFSMKIILAPSTKEF
jgi:type IV pilus assembly protein PilM